MSRSKTAESADETRTRLRTAGLRSTAPRIAVLQRLLAAEAPLSHAEIADHLVPQGFDRASVYRNLVDLHQAGLVTRTDVGDHTWRFEVRRDGEESPEEHPHFVCTDCGEVACLEGVAVQIPRSPKLPKSVRKGRVELQIRGVCDDCN